MLIKTVSGFELGGSTTPAIQDAIKHVEEGAHASVQFHPRCSLLPGIYYLNAGATRVVDGCPCFLHRIVDAVMLRVEEEGAMSQSGIVDFEIEPSLDMTVCASVQG